MAVNGFDTNLNGFRQVIGDYTRQYMFRIEIPEILASDARGRVTTFFARSTTLPDYNIQTTDIGFQGLKLKVATTATFADWSVTFMADEKQYLRAKLLQWASYVYDAGTMTPATINAYKADNLKATQLDRSGNDVMTYRFFGAFPKTVKSPTFNHDTLNIGTFDTTFAFDLFTISDSTNYNFGATNQRPNIYLKNLVGTGSPGAANPQNATLGSQEKPTGLDNGR